MLALSCFKDNWTCFLQPLTGLFTFKLPLNMQEATKYNFCKNIATGIYFSWSWVGKIPHSKPPKHKMLVRSTMFPSLLTGAIFQIETDWLILHICDWHNESAALIVSIIQGKQLNNPIVMRTKNIYLIIKKMLNTTKQFPAWAFFQCTHHWQFAPYCF